MPTRNDPQRVLLAFSETYSTTTSERVVSQSTAHPVCLFVDAKIVDKRSVSSLVPVFFRRGRVPADSPQIPPFHLYEHYWRHWLAYSTRSFHRSFAQRRSWECEE